MARVTLGSGISDIRGKVGGSVYQRSAQGLTLRTKTTPVNRSSVAQTAQRARAATSQSAWQNLTDQQRTAWNANAQFNQIASGKAGNTIATGQQAYMQLSFYLLQLGVAVPAEPVFLPYNLPPTGLTMSQGGPTLIMSFDGEVDSGDYWPIAQVSLPLRSASNTPGAALRFMLPLSMSATDWTISQPYIDAYGFLAQTGQRVKVVWFLLDLASYTLGPLSTQVVEIG